jgi:hypothetical protein
MGTAVDLRRADEVGRLYANGVLLELAAYTDRDLRP